MLKNPWWDDPRKGTVKQQPTRRKTPKTPDDVLEARQAGIDSLSEGDRRKRAVNLLKRRAFGLSLPKYDGTKQQSPTAKPEPVNVWDELPTTGMRHGDLAVLEDGTEYRYDGTQWRLFVKPVNRVVLARVSRKDDTKLTEIAPTHKGNLLAKAVPQFQQSPAPTPREDEMPRFYKWPSRVPVW